MRHYEYSFFLVKCIYIFFCERRCSWSTDTTHARTKKNQRERKRICDREKSFSWNFHISPLKFTIQREKTFFWQKTKCSRLEKMQKHVLHTSKKCKWVGNMSQENKCVFRPESRGHHTREKPWHSCWHKEKRQDFLLLFLVDASMNRVSQQKSMHGKYTGKS